MKITKEEFIQLIRKLPVKIDPTNHWEPNPKYREELVGTKKAQKKLLHSTLQIKMIKLEDVIKLINNIEYEDN